jgi:hypothetical protein
VDKIKRGEAGSGSVDDPDVMIKVSVGEAKKKPAKKKK